METAYRLLQTDRVPLEEMTGIPGFKRRRLRLDEKTGATVEVQYAPPGFDELVRYLNLEKGAWSAHYHRTVTERHYFLSGDFPAFEWVGPEASPQLFVHEAHSFLDRPPFSIHGSMEGYVSKSGSEYLVWNTGPGTSIKDPEAVTETISLPGEIPVGDQQVPFVSPTIIQADQEHGEAFPYLPQIRRVVLAKEIEHSPQTDLWIIPQGTVPARKLVSRAGDIRWLYILEGDLELKLRTVDQLHQLNMTRGSFLDLSRPADLVIDSDAPLSHGGCKAITVGIDFTDAARLTGVVH